MRQGGWSEWRRLQYDRILLAVAISSALLLRDAGHEWDALLTLVVAFQLFFAWNIWHARGPAWARLFVLAMLGLLVSACGVGFTGGDDWEPRTPMQTPVGTAMRTVELVLGIGGFLLAPVCAIAGLFLLVRQWLVGPRISPRRSRARGRDGASR